MHVCIFGFLAISLFELILTAIGPKRTVLNCSNITELLDAMERKPSPRYALNPLIRPKKVQPKTIQCPEVST